MSHICISHRHSLEHAQAIAEAEQLLEELSQEYGVAINCLNEGCFGFSGSGVEGTVHVNPENIEVQARLGFLAMAIKPMLEAKIQEKLEQHFS